MVRHKLNKSTLAFRCECQPNDLARYLDGRRLPTLLILDRIARKLGIPVETLTRDALDAYAAAHPPAVVDGASPSLTR
jgi:transcriptional regulator with XRE-family HTH domain